MKQKPQPASPNTIKPRLFLPILPTFSFHLRFQLKLAHVRAFTLQHKQTTEETN